MSKEYEPRASGLDEITARRELIKKLNTATAKDIGKTAARRTKISDMNSQPLCPDEPLPDSVYPTEPPDIAA